jgi:hypothetical protein
MITKKKKSKRKKGVLEGFAEGGVGISKKKKITASKMCHMTSFV